MKRQPKGSPIGGQFAPDDRNDADLSLTNADGELTMVSPTEFDAVRQGNDHSGADFRMHHINGEDEPGSNFDNTDMRTATVENCVWDNSTFTDTRANDIAMREVSATHARIEGGSFDDARLVDCQMDGSTWKEVSVESLGADEDTTWDGARFSRCTMHGAMIGNIGGKFSATDCTGDRAQMTFNSAQVSLDRSRMREAKFFGSVTDSSFDHCELPTASFERMTFKNSSLMSSTLTDSSFYKCSFEDGSVLNRSTLRNCGFTETTMTDADLSDSTLSQSSFNNCDFDGGRASHATMSETDWKNVTATGTGFIGASLEGSTMRDVRLESTDFHRANFKSTTLENVTFEHATLAGTTFTAASSRDVAIRDTSMVGMKADGLRDTRGTWADNDASRSDFSGSTFDDADMYKVKFAGANLRGARFSHSRLSDVDFSGADLRDVDFSDTELDSCNFDGARTEGAKGLPVAP